MDTAQAGAQEMPHGLPATVAAAAATPRFIGTELELDGGTREEAVGAVQDAQPSSSTPSALAACGAAGSMLTRHAAPPSLHGPSRHACRGILAELEALVNTDRGSYTPAGVSHVADQVAASLAELGAAVERISHEPASGEPQRGDLVVGRLDGEGRVGC